MSFSAYWIFWYFRYFELHICLDYEWHAQYLYFTLYSFSQVKQYPKLVKDVKLAIEELGMVTVLWEEQWLSTLQDLHSGKSVLCFCCPMESAAAIIENVNTQL